MRLYIVDVDGQLYSVRQYTRNGALLEAIEKYVEDFNEAPKKQPVVVGFYTNRGKYVPLLQ